MDPETGAPDFSDEHLRTLPFRMRAADTLRKAEEAAMVRADQSRLKKEEATHASGLRMDEGAQDQENALALEGAKQDNRLALEESRQGGDRDLEATKQENRLALERVRSENRTGPKNKKPVDQRAAETIREAREMGVELNYNQAMIIIDPKRLQKSVDPDTGNEVWTDNKGNPVDDSPVYEYVRLKSGGKKRAERMDLGAAGSPQVVMEALQQAIAGQGGGTPATPAAPPARRPRAPDMLQTNPY